MPQFLCQVVLAHAILHGYAKLVPASVCGTSACQHSKYACLCMAECTSRPGRRLSQALLAHIQGQVRHLPSGESGKEYSMTHVCCLVMCAEVASLQVVTCWHVPGAAACLHAHETLASISFGLMPRLWLTAILPRRQPTGADNVSYPSSAISTPLWCLGLNPNLNPKTTHHQACTYLLNTACLLGAPSGHGMFLSQPPNECTGT